MRRFYVVIFTLFFLCILLFIASFVYLDKEKHNTYYYTINLDGFDIGTIRVDRYITEDKRLYRSVSKTPFDPVFTSSRSKMVLNKEYGLESYTRKIHGNGAAEEVHLDNRTGALSFVAISRSEFSCLSNIPVKHGTFIFNEDSPMTYLPLLENYDFRRGRSQGFNAITPFSTFLPPIKRFVTLTSIKNEYLAINSKKIKAECLLLKIRNYPQGVVWVSRTDKSLLRIEIPTRQLIISRTFGMKDIEAKDYLVKSDDYISKDVSFKKKNTQLSGILYTPKKEGKFPSIILVAGDGAEDMRNEGLFTAMAESLVKEDCLVLIFDKRGIGSSQGNWDSATDTDNIEDVNAALDFLKSQKETDPERMFIAGHLKGALYAAKTASARSDVKALIMMSPMILSDIAQNMNFDAVKGAAIMSKWGDDYIKLINKTRLETMDKIKDGNRRWASILNRRCFLAKMRDELKDNPIDSIKSIKTPVLIVQGKGADASGIEAASAIDQALEAGGNKDHILIYFSYLGDFLGKRVADGIHKIHYEADPGVLKAIKDWMARIPDTQPVETTAQK